MGSIQDILGKRLPINNKFEAKKFKKNLSSAIIQSPALGILKDNQDAINEVIGDSSNRSKIRRGLTQSEAKTMLQKIKKEDASISPGDLKLLKEMLASATRENRSKSDVPTSASSTTQKQNKKESRVAAIKEKLKPSPKRELPDFLKNRGSLSVKKNPWAPDAGRVGSGGGINAAQGGGTLAGSAASGSFRPPSLRK